MEGNNFQSSFIPKKPLVDGVAKTPRTTSFFSLVATVIFITVLVLVLGVFGFKYYVEASIESAKVKLDAEIKRFEPSLVSKLSRANNRIESAKEILNYHTALSSFFTFLGSSTIKSVRFDSFKYNPDASDPQKATVVMTGQAHSFAAVALQSAEFLKQENQNYIQNPIFSNLNLDQSGNVVFTFTGTVQPGFITYRSTLNPNSAMYMPATSGTPATGTSTATSTQ